MSYRSSLYRGDGVVIQFYSGNVCVADYIIIKDVLDLLFDIIWYYMNLDNNVDSAQGPYYYIFSHLFYLTVSFCSLHFTGHVHLFAFHVQRSHIDALIFLFVTFFLSHES